MFSTYCSTCQNAKYAISHRGVVNLVLRGPCRRNSHRHRSTYSIIKLTSTKKMCLLCALYLSGRACLWEFYRIFIVFFFFFGDAKRTMDRGGGIRRGLGMKTRKKRKNESKNSSLITEFCAYTREITSEFRCHMRDDDDLWNLLRFVANSQRLWRLVVERGDTHARLAIVRVL